MSISTIQNFYKETITRAVTLTGATNIYVSALPTPSEGYVVISPSSSTLREIVYYTAKGTDGNGTYLTVTLANRGLGGTTAQTHAIGEPVRMNVTAEHIKEISDALDEIVAGGAQDASTITKGITKLSVAPASATEPIAVGDNDPRVLDNPAEIKFGGTGADGALEITSGTTTIDCAGAAVVTKNYTSISITGDGKLAFSNPHANGTIIILKSQGNVTISSSASPAIDAKGIGAGSGTKGNSNLWGVMTNKGTDGDASGSGTYGQGGALLGINIGKVAGKFIPLFCGAGGGNGNYDSGTNARRAGGGGASLNNNGSNGSTSGGGIGNTGEGGRGGGSLLIEVGGTYTCSGTISCAGNNGTAGSPSGAEGGGGAGGSIVVLYNNLGSDTGTYTVTKGNGAGSNTGHGGDGYSLVALNTEFN